ncbi:hypothetical protein VP275E431_P0024 [Vibrio phage 275E43-1]|nr:hypothetical protein VP275E431_P0024 [Vibrio phage 275E43-1]
MGCWLDERKLLQAWGFCEEYISCLVLSIRRIL